jgi:long-chain acyl-CoA synthetase
MTVLVTGATGFVGTEVLARLLRDGDEPLCVLVRGRDDDDARRRLASLLDGLGAGPEQRARVRAVRGEMTLAGLGLSSADTARVLHEVTSIVHCAASVSFTLPLAQARAINVGGTREVVRLAERLADRGRLRRLVHVSTAYVAGCHRGRFGERDLWVGQAFRNTYERTKAEAEAVVQDSAARLPVVVVRPSIVVGDSGTGWTPSFNVLYWPLRAFARGLLPAIPARADGRVDVVPVDYVADVILHLLRERADVGGTVHAAAGDDALTVEQLIELACTTLGRDRPRLGPAAVDLVRHSEHAAAYLPYFDMQVVFDDATARAVLRPAGIVPTPLAAYFETLLDFARRARWGKSPIARAAA